MRGAVIDSFICASWPHASLTALAAPATGIDEVKDLVVHAQSPKNTKDKVNFKILLLLQKAYIKYKKYL